MFRSILGMTTAISLTLPMAAFGQTDAHETVRDVLDRYGYDVAEMEALTTSQVAEIYLTVTSEDSGDVRRLLSGMNLTPDMGDATTERSEMIDARVQEILDAEGYDPAVVDFMSDGEVVQIYLSATSDDSPQLGRQLDAMDLPRAGEMDMADVDVVSNIDVIVTDELQTMGYTQAQIDTLSDAEVSEIYLVMTSEDQTEVRTAIERALES